MKDRGVLYFLIAGKDRGFRKKVMGGHGKFLSNSLESLNKHMSDIPTALFTDIDSVDWKEFGFDIVTYKDMIDIWVYKYECLLETPFLKTVHMDCDTYVCGSFYEVFDMLDKIDFAAPISPAYFGRWPLDVPISFPELAGGFMAYKSSDKVNKMLEYAKRLIIARKGGCDEPYMRKALYEFTNVKHSVLPLEYNCVFWFPGYLTSNVKVLHGKIHDIEPVKECFAGKNPKLFTGESIIHCDYASRKKYKIGLIQNYAKLVEEHAGVKK